MREAVCICLFVFEHLHVCMEARMGWLVITVRLFEYCPLSLAFWLIHQGYIRYDTYF
jgi:hypothetical protein